MAIRVRVLRDFSGRFGAIVHAGEFVDFEDDADGYNLIHAGLAEPPLRLRTAVDCLVGTTNVSAGDMVDVDPGIDPRTDRRFEPLAAVVAGKADSGFSGTTNWSVEAGEVMAVAPAFALQVVASGGRYATREEAAGLDLGGSDRFAKPEPTEPTEPTGPTTRLFFLNATTLPDGRSIRGDQIVAVADEHVDDLVGRRVAERLVKARVKVAGLVFNRNCEAGEVVDVPKSVLPFRCDQLEPIAGAVEKALGKAVDVLASVGAAAAEKVEKVAKPAAKRAAVLEAGEAR